LLPLISQQFVQFETYSLRLLRLQPLRPTTLHPFPEHEKSKSTTLGKPLFDLFIRLSL